MTLTHVRTIQYIGILLALAAIAGGYWYFAVRAGVKTNTAGGQAAGTGDLAAGLVGYWKLDENTGTSAADSSVNAITALTLTNGPTWTTGQIGTGIDFDGTDDYATTADTATLDFGNTDNITITGWFNRDTFTTEDTIVAKRNGQIDSDGGYSVYIGASNDLVQFDLSDAIDGYQIHGSTAITATGWHHFAVTWDQDAAANAKVYVDGRDDTGTVTGTIGNIGDLSTALAFRLGAESDGGAPFDGKLDEMRVYDRVLSADEVSKLYRTTTPTSVDTSLKGYWSFSSEDDRSSTLIADRSGARNTGTLTNGPTKGAGRIGQALTFDGSNDYFDMTDIAALDGLTALTLSAWVKTTASDERQILGKSDCTGGTGDGPFELFMASGGLPGTTLYKNGGSPDYYRVDGTGTINDGTWHFVTATYDGSNVRVYTDGTLSNSTAAAGITLTSTTNKFQIGGDCNLSGAGSSEWNGNIDEARVYSRALSATEIKSLYDGGSADRVNTSATQAGGVGRLESSLVGYWKLDENTGTSAADSSTNAITAGTLTNGPTWTTGQIGTGVDFDGTNDYITVADTALLDFGDTDPFTLSGWFNRDTFTTDDFIIAKSNDIFDTGYTVVVDDATDTLVFIAAIDGSNFYAVPSASVFTATGWHHFSVTWNGSVGHVYIDGKLDEGSPTAVGTVGSLANARTFRIGAESDDGNPFDGKLDEIRVYDRVLLADEASNLYRLTAPTGVDTGLKGYWSFNASDMLSTAAYDRSGARNTGTLTNGPAKVIGRIGQALSFDASNDYVTMGDINALDGLTAITASAWAKTTSVATERHILDKSGCSGSTDGGVFELMGGFPAANKAGFVIYKSGGSPNHYDVASSMNIDDGNWHMITGTYDGAAVRVYVDGVLAGTTTAASVTMPTTTFPVEVGGNCNGSPLLWNGSIDEARVYSRALSASEIKSLYDSSAPDKTNTSASTPQGTGNLNSGLTAYWKLDENTGTSAADSSTNAITSLTLTNGPAWTTGQIGTGIDFDGTDDYATTADTDVLDSVSRSEYSTISGWFNRDTFTTDDTIVAKRNGIAAGDTGYIVYIDDATDQLVFEMSDGVDEISLTSTSTFTATGWNHFAIVSNEDENGFVPSDIYINGVANNATESGNIFNVEDTANAVAFRLGAESDNGNPFDGKLDEARLYNRALSADEVANLYRLSAPTGADTGLKGYWSFNGADMSGTTALDRSGAGNNGTIGNTPTKTIGKLGQALNFDTADADYMTMGDINTLDGVTALTASAWVRTTSMGVESSIVSKSGCTGAADAGTFELFGGFTEVGVVNFGVYKLNGSPNDYVASSTTRVDDGAWHLVTGTYDGVAVRVYVDGVESGSVAAASITTPSTSEPLEVGGCNAGGTGPMEGDIDEVRVYNRALSASEVKALYSSGR